MAGIMLMDSAVGPPPPTQAWTLTPMGDSGVTNLYGIAAAPGGRLVACGTGGARAAYSDDEGATWTPCVGAGAGAWYAVAHGPSGFMLTGTDAVAFSADGITFTVVALVGGDWVAVVWAPVVARWVTFRATFADQTAAWSDDDGATWHEVDTAVAVYGYRLASDAAGLVMSAGYTDNDPLYDKAAAMASDDGGATWDDLGVIFGSALEPDYAVGIAWLPVLGRWLAASAYDVASGGHGAFKSDDDGATWQSVNALLDAVYNIAGNPADVALFLASSGARISEDGGATTVVAVDGSAPDWYSACWSAAADAFFATDISGGGLVARVKLQ